MSEEKFSDQIQSQIKSFLNLFMASFFSSLYSHLLHLLQPFVHLIKHLFLSFHDNFLLFLFKTQDNKVKDEWSEAWNWKVSMKMNMIGTNEWKNLSLEKDKVHRELIWFLIAHSTCKKQQLTYAKCLKSDKSYSNFVRSKENFD